MSKGIVLHAIAQRLVSGLGGAGNIVDLEPCITRIRVEIRDPNLVDESLIRGEGVIALVRTDEVIQIVAGADSDAVEALMRDQVEAEGGLGGAKT